MKRAALAAALALVVCAPLAAVCSGHKMPGADAPAIWEYITKINPYKSWKQWPDFKGMQQTRSPHGPYVQVYVNDLGFNMKKPPAPYGVIEVKEGYGPDKKLKNITVQYKVKGFNPSAGDWYWVKYTPKGKAGPAGKPRGCVSCHGARADNDYMLTHFFD